jgi:UDP-N-acetyl-D-galactosamine dehydrogenase
MKKEKIIAIVGLGYVGLPLALVFGEKRRTIGFDTSESKILDYRRNIDRTGEVTEAEFAKASRLEFTCDPRKLREAELFIVAVPTPVDEAHVPDLGPLKEASVTVGKHLRRGAIIVFESTVYPGATEDVCVPIIEQASGLIWQRDFSVGYSPERINPGDKEHTLKKILKVVSADSPESLDEVAKLYESVIDAGVYRASAIRIAEAAKVIENTQRDLNIALMNELAIIFHQMNIDTIEVTKAAATKWNFLPFKPGLVGGHCIGVDPYYLTYKAEQIGYHPQVILAGRRINDGMAKYVATEIVKNLAKDTKLPMKACAVVLGITFKENCTDVRNSKVADLVRELEEFGITVYSHDPLADVQHVKYEYDISLLDYSDIPLVDVLVLAVPHDKFLQFEFSALSSKLKPGGLVVDIKSVLDPNIVHSCGYRLWRL